MQARSYQAWAVLGREREIHTGEKRRGGSHVVAGATAEERRLERGIEIGNHKTREAGGL
jgi:hypothetical protein